MVLRVLGVDAIVVDAVVLGLPNGLVEIGVVAEVLPRVDVVALILVDLRQRLYPVVLPSSLRYCYLAEDQTMAANRV